jgi:hypothetical protein
MDDDVTPNEKWAHHIHFYNQINLTNDINKMCDLPKKGKKRKKFQKTTT